MKKATREQVAKLAGVSVATVSYVLNNSRSVSEKSRELVLKAVKELDYKVDMIARSMATNETKQLCIVLHDIVNPFFSEIILGFENAAIKEGYFVNICTGYKNIDEYFDNFIARRIDGVFIAALPYKFHSEKYYNLVNNGIKVVISGNIDVDVKKVSSIENDYMDGMEKSVEYLVSLGHRNIAYISGLGRTQKFDRKIEGYLEAIKKFDLPCGDSLLFDKNTSFGLSLQDGYNLTKKLLASGRPFSALIYANDLMAIGGMKALKEEGYRIPDDISVIGFDDICFDEFIRPSITTVAVPKMYLGQKAFELLHTNIKRGSTGFYMNKVELIVRESTGPCRT